jgi:hypothetical protein
MANGEENDTTDNNPYPLVLENRGNVFARIVNISLNQSLFESVFPPSDNFQMRINFTDELNSFNFSASLTEFFNLSGNDRSIISDFDYHDSNDTARLDLRVKIPADEPDGEKISGMVVFGIQR